ncbi:hypothetical protein N0V90_009768 [Kalmusia sp. IMI 367209]|nr:hypothetical protein N0V90_009768 [Kalmusia sp. IMI 367209]
MTLIYTRNGILYLSLSFLNDLITLLSTLPAAFEEALTRISVEQREAERVDKDVPKDQQMLVINDEFKDELREVLLKLRSERRTEYEALVEKFPGTESIAGLPDPRTGMSGRAVIYY